MSAKPKIKVIKKGQVTEVRKPVENERKSKQAAAREMVSTVSNWVNDFQQRKRTETRNAFEQLFAAQPKTSEV